MARRKRFRQLEIGSCNMNAPSETAESGLFDAVSDDAVLNIMQHAIALPENARGIEVHNAVIATGKDLCALLLTCQRMRAILDGPGVSLQQEMAARAATQIVPPSLQGDYPFTQQMRFELLSSDQLNVMREVIEKMASHCAGPCCQRVRNEFNRPRQRLSVVAKRSTLITTSSDGHRAFISSRQRTNGSLHGKQRQHGRSALTSEWILLVEANGCDVTNRVELADLAVRGAPQSMRSNPSGTACAMIRPFHSIGTADGETPHSCVMVWDTRRTKAGDGVEACTSMLVAPFDAIRRGAVNAQDAWWALSEEGEQLVVLWSTAYVHPMGSVVGANADTACYFLAVYNSTDGYLEYEIETYTGPFPGKAQTASPTASGVEAAILLRRSAMGHGPGSLATRETVLHDVFCEHRVEVAHENAVAAGRGPFLSAHPADLATCPSAVALSPLGDCIVAIHRRGLSVLVEILIRTSGTVFVSVQSIDVTHWTSVGRGEPSVFDADAENQPFANSLKLPYHITFSPCGRFAAIVDQRTLFGMGVANHSVVVLDMALRHERRGVRALPLAPVEDVAPRSLDWTATGIWMQARYGALLLKSV